MPMDVWLVTSRELADLTDDDRPLVGALARLGLSAAPAVWDDPAVDWSRARLAVIRSPWDYADRRADFLAWVDSAASLVRVENPPDVLRWNTSKTYLRAMEADGIAIVPTLWLERGFTGDAGRLLRERGWSEAVVKPVVSAGARNTFRVAAVDATPTVARLAPAHELMLQPYLR